MRNVPPWTLIRNGTRIRALRVATIKYQAKVSPSVQPPKKLQHHHKESRQCVCNALQFLEEEMDEPVVLSPKNLMENQKYQDSIQVNQEANLPNTTDFP